MVDTAHTSSVPDRFASMAGRRDRMPNTAGHRFADSRTEPRAGNDAGPPPARRRKSIVHRTAGRDVILRRAATRRRLARIDPESVERRAWRLIGGASSPTHP